MGKNYEVEIKAYATVVVLDAEDEDHARELAEDEMFGSDYDIDEIRTTEIADNELEMHKRHATKIAEG